MLLLLFTVIRDVSAQSTENFPRLTPSPEAQNYAAEPDTADWKKLYSLALWVSGAPDSSTASDFVPVINELESKVASLDERQKAEAVLQFMHERFLKAYREHQTRFDTLLTTGGFNCVSSAVLYTVLGTAVGLDITGVMTTDHAFCSVKIGDERTDVETTSIYGFDPGAKKEFTDAFGRTTGFAYVPPRNYRDRASIDIISLFSLVIKNRISDSESAGNFSDTVGLAADRWALLGKGGEESFGELIDRMVNYGSYLAQRGNEEAALDWAGKAIRVYGPHPKWDDFVDSAANNLLVKLIRRKDIAKARSLLEELRPRLTEKTAGRFDVMVSESELLEALDSWEQGGDDSKFTEALDAAKAAGVVPAERVREIEIVWRLNRVKKIAENEGWAAAYEETSRIISELGSDRQLENAQRVYRSNRIAELYNSAVNVFNSGNQTEALSLVEKAIGEFPDDSRLKSLKTNIERAIETGR